MTFGSSLQKIGSEPIVTADGHFFWWVGAKVTESVFLTDFCHPWVLKTWKTHFGRVLAFPVFVCKQVVTDTQLHRPELRFQDLESKPRDEVRQEMPL